ncbi:PKD domain-containing protein [Chitinophaga sp. 22321]|uniref:PKD domain-containing protein n=1 Tax=Chitinophaga hostae TaxID=2831022 RepID=A0ABS5JD45_9BACT|nr:PKD domain-containing protein [Chitinophaga hostae]MBS0032397.1 PKD domain-containing protein [Chitinophaga hostae]
MAPRKPENERKVTSFRPFGKIASHVDPMVLWTFLGLFLISIVLLAFQLDGKEDCSNTDIKLSHIQNSNSKAYAVGEVITFNAETPDKKTAAYTWEFGDSSAKATGKQVYHSFNKAGSYLVTLTSGKCTWNREVLVIMNTPVATAGNAADIFPVIDGPSEAFAGRPVTFSNKTPSAREWVWRLLQDNADTHTNSSVTYTFSSPGERTLSLIINGDSSHMVLKHITVFPARPAERPDIPQPVIDPTPLPTPTAPPPPPPEKKPSISDDEFKYLLIQVTQKQKSASDFAQYLCNNLNARVVLNADDVDNFAHFCSRIYGKKKFKIERVNLTKTPDGCINEILIKYDRKKVLGIF